MSVAVTRGPGRPRSEEIDAAILQATIDELIERGFLGASMESIAARAGVAKTTLYRRWPNTTELTIAAMRTFDADDAEPPAGTVREQLLWLIHRMRRKWGDPRFAAMMRRVAADGSAQPEMYRSARDRLVGPHSARMTAVLQRAIDEGLIRPDLDLEWARQLLVSPVMAGALTLKDKVSAKQIELTVDTVLRGLAP
ncbi:TetR/AcrR family transcriptional regulator [Jatrophihabitans sp.]|uniref:TetR/AcrR family transcriptional regulator n=1 Tax=Jatrophihabitans sp. TaxID=1932789 RepID=UPI0030C76183|nr:transcriptional regulator, TetR family [Jatrophihabitans sp.]